MRVVQLLNTTPAGSFPTNLLLLSLSLSLQAADLLLGQRGGVLLLLRRPQPELEVGHLPLQLHDPGALRHRGHLQHHMQKRRHEGKEEAGELTE